MFLEVDYNLHAKPTDPPFLACLEALVLRYHPKSKRLNPQGNLLDLKNHWALPASVMELLRQHCGITTELFASPLNCSLAPGLTYFSAFPEDAIFGATFDCMLYQWVGSNQANPEYEPADMLAAFRRAIDSACASPLPFSCVLILPDWVFSPYRHPELLTHPSVRLLTSVPAKHFRFVPPDQDTSCPDAHTRADVAKWKVDFFVVANAAGLAEFIAPHLAALQRDMAVALRAISGFQDLHIATLPEITGLPEARTDLPMAPSSSPPSHPHGLVAALPTPHPVQFSPLWLRNPSITHIPRYTLITGTPLTVVEMCAGIATGLESLLSAGHTIHSYTWADSNPAAWAATRHRIGLLHARFPAQFPASASEGWDTRLPFNICSITPAMLTRCFPTGIDMIIAGPPCQPYSAAGHGRGLADPRSHALLATTRILTFLNATQPKGVGYIIENVPGTDRHPAVRATLGTGTTLDAPACGSHARREAIFWQNFMCPRALRHNFRLLPQGPSTTLNEMLSAAGFDNWRSQHLTLGKNMPPIDKYNQAGRDQKVLPKFVCFKGSHQFCLNSAGRPALGMLRLNGVPTIPTADIKELCMGFHVGDTKAIELTEDERSHLLGKCIDRHLLTWLVRQISTNPGPGSEPPRPPPPPPTPAPSWASLAFATGPPCPDLTPNVRYFQEGSRPHLRRPLRCPAPPPPLGHLPLSPILPFQARWKHDKFTYTDGSKKPTCPTLGAAIFHAPTGELTLIDASGYAENNTNNRAELAAIHQALVTYSDKPSLHILTDSLGSIQKIQAQLRRPRTTARGHHRRLLEAVVHQLVLRDMRGLKTTIRKVPAHANVAGNERADAGAKAVVDAHDQQLATTLRHTLGATPFRRPVTTFAIPAATPDPAAADPTEPRAFTSVKQLRKHVHPILGMYTSRPSQYRNLFLHLEKHEGALLHLPSAHIQSRLRSGNVRDAMRLFKYLWGTLYCGKLAKRYKHAQTDECPLCHFPDSCTHIGSGCPKHTGLYISRHDAAVRMIADYLLHSPKGASALHQSLRLLSRDAGRNERPMTEDFDELVSATEEILADWDSVDLSSLSVGTDIVNTDVTLDGDQLRMAAEALHTQQAKGPIPPPKYLPDWVMSTISSNHLRACGHGVTPDLVFGLGVPDVTDPTLAKFDRSKCTLVLIEVGFCADLRCHQKHQAKLDKYEPLLQELRRTWGHVHLVIVPIGCAGTLLARTQEALATALATNPSRPPLKEAAQLMKRLSAFAAQRLLSIIHTRYRSTAPTQSSQGPAGPRGSQTSSLTYARRPP